MRPNDLPELERRLAELADALGGKPVTKGALRVWLDTLAECQRDDVLAVLTDWPKAHAKTPLPAEVLKAARERMSDRIEAQAKREAAQARQDWKPESLRPERGPSAAYDQFKRDLAVLRRKPRPGPKAWAWKLRERELAGEVLNSVQRENWRAALKGEVTDADDEAQAERLAIMTEGV